MVTAMGSKVSSVSRAFKTTDGRYKPKACRITVNGNMRTEIQTKLRAFFHTYFKTQLIQVPIP